ncbi:unnamed protein product, partial [Ectocarpus sp. 4 AP-2014]
MTFSIIETKKHLHLESWYLPLFRFLVSWSRFFSSLFFWLLEIGQAKMSISLCVCGHNVKNRRLIQEFKIFQHLGNPNAHMTGKGRIMYTKVAVSGCVAGFAVSSSHPERS